MTHDPKSGMITEHFSWAEAFITQHREISNSPTDDEFDQIMINIARTAVKMEKVRALLSCPLVINSWYRSPALNAAVGGVKNSDHITGQAVDFISPQFGSCAQIARKLLESKSLIGFKQLILEHTWVHISFPIPGVAPKLEVLSLLSDGKYSIGLTDKQGNPLA